MEIQIDDGIYYELEALAKKRHSKVGHLLNKIISEYCANQKNPAKSAAPPGYGLRPGEKKVR